MIKNISEASSLKNQEEINYNQIQILIKKELLYFKNDVLKDFKQIEINLNTKYNENSIFYNNKIKEFDEKLNLIFSKMSKIEDVISLDNILNEKVDKLYEFKEKIKEKLISEEIKLESLNKELHNIIYKYDNMLSKSILYPGIIGNLCKFKTFHDFIDYVINQINILTQFKDKNILDLQSYKKKLEIIVDSFKLQISNFNKENYQIINQKINESELKFYDHFKIYDDKIHNIRLENSKYVINSKKEFDNILNEWKKILDIKNEIFGKFEDEIPKFHNSILKKFEGYKKEFNVIKNRFIQLSEFIKDVRFRINIGEDVKRDVLKLSKKIDFSKKQIIEKEDLKTINNNSFIDNLLQENIRKKNSLKKNIIHSRKNNLNEINSNVNYSFSKNKLSNERSISLSSIDNSFEEIKNRNSEQIVNNKSRLSNSEILKTNVFISRNKENQNNLSEKHNHSVIINKSENNSSNDFFHLNEINKRDNNSNKKEYINKNKIEENHKRNNSNVEINKINVSSLNKYHNIFGTKKIKNLNQTFRNKKNDEFLIQSKSYSNFPIIYKINVKKSNEENNVDKINKFKITNKLKELKNNNNKNNNILNNNIAKNIGTFNNNDYNNNIHNN